jgi:hypothetical protein
MGDPIEVTEVQQKTPVSAIRIVLAGLMVAMGIGILAFAMTGSNAANKDFVTYWAAGKQLVRHANPYDGAEILRLEREAGCKENRPYFMRNPPTAFFLALPFGLMSEWPAAVIWSLLLVASVVISIRMIWMMEGRPAGRLHLIGYIFPPVLECLTIGQVGILLLLGFTGFLYFHKTRPFVAGLFLVLCSIKPHLFIPLGVVLVLWCVQSRSYRILAGIGIGLAGCVVLTQIVDPAAWGQYFQMMRAENLKDEPIPTISLLFRAAISLHTARLQFVPAIVATIWAVWYFRRSGWGWCREGLLLLTVSVMVAPYVWLTDEAVVLPAILQGIYVLVNKGRSLTPFVCIVLPVLVGVVAGKAMDSWWYVWTTPAWLGFYLYAIRSKPKLVAVEA